MRTRWLQVAVLLSVLTARPVRAGLYFPAEPTPWPLPTNPQYFELILGERQNVGSRDAQVRKLPLRIRIEEMIKQLELKRRSVPGLTLEESLNLSACYLLQPIDEGGRSRVSDAIMVLDKVRAQRQDPRHFMVLANLATAYEAMGESMQASEIQSDVLAVWPRQHKGFAPEQLRWYRRAEECYREILRRRGREGPARRREAKLDAIFPRVDELGAEKTFQVGGIDPQIASELPPDALPLVEQLLLWRSNDHRLLWLYAELLNANGEKKWAETFLSRLIYGGFNSSAAKEHRTALRENLAPPPPDEPPPWVPEWRSVLIGLGSGVLVGVLLVLQLQVLFRRPRSPDRLTVSRS